MKVPLEIHCWEIEGCTFERMSCVLLIHVITVSVLCLEFTY